MASSGLTSVALHLSCTWKNPEQYEIFQMRLPLQTSTPACCDTILDGHTPVKLLQDQGHARGAVAGTWSCLEVPVSPQPRQCHTSAQHQLVASTHSPGQGLLCSTNGNRVEQSATLCCKSPPKWL